MATAPSSGFKRTTGTLSGMFVLMSRLFMRLPLLLLTVVRANCCQSCRWWNDLMAATKAAPQPATARIIPIFGE